MSATTFGGSAQFAVASLLDAGGAAAAAIAAALMLNARYVPIGISVASSFEGPVWRRLLQAQLIVDESWAVALKRRGGFDVRVLLGAGGLLYVDWVSGTVVGVLVGDTIGDAESLGLDAAFPALFLALLVPQLTRPARARGCAPRGRDRARVDPVHARRRADSRRRCGVPPRVPAVSTVWLCVVVVGAASISLQGDGTGAPRAPRAARVAGRARLACSRPPSSRPSSSRSRSPATASSSPTPRLAGLAVGAVAVAAPRAAARRHRCRRRHGGSLIRLF